MPYKAAERPVVRVLSELGVAEHPVEAPLLLPLQPLGRSMEQRERAVKTEIDVRRPRCL